MLVGTLDRAKTIKNAVTVNEELTAEEWKRRFEKEREKTTRYKAKLEKAEAELNRWRSGESVGQEDQVSIFYYSLFLHPRGFWHINVLLYSRKFSFSYS